MASVSTVHIILTPTQPVGSGRPQRESNPGPPHQESSALPTELPRPPKKAEKKKKKGQNLKEIKMILILISFYYQYHVPYNSF